MPDHQDRWCLFYDFEMRPSPKDGPLSPLVRFVNPLLERVRLGEAKKTLDRDRRVVRIADGRRLMIGNDACVALVITLGNSAAANPSFIDFEGGVARDAERRVGEVPGTSAHCILRLTPDPESPFRHRMLLEESAGLGRSTVERLFNSELSAIAAARRDTFVRERTNSRLNVRPVVHMSGHQSRQMEDALAGGTFGPIELINTTPDPRFESQPEFQVKGHVLRVKVTSNADGMRGALDKLKTLAHRSGYDRMRIRWRSAGAARDVDSDIHTDLDDIGEALFTKRALVHVDQPLSTCSHQLRDDFVQAIAAAFV